MGRVTLPNGLFIYSELETKYLMAIQLIQRGQGTASQFNDLLDMTDLLLLGANSKHDLTILELCHLGREMFANMADRYHKTQRVWATGEEIKLLRVLADTSKDFWCRQSGRFLAHTLRGLKALRKLQRERQSNKQC